MPKTVVIPLKCEHCGKGVTVECEHHPGFGYMNFYAIDCPHCGKRNHPQLPGDVVDVRRSSDAQEKSE
jgi:endogenous inhibitor of DNA gyrase (YacG/DUF329 family)